MFTRFDIIRNLVMMLGYEIQPNTNILIDQETKTPIKIDDKFIKVQIDPDKQVYISNSDVLFDPLNPKCTKMLECMFEAYANESIVEYVGYELVAPPFFDITRSDDDKIPSKYRLFMKFDDGSRYCGNWFINKICCFIEAIFFYENGGHMLDLRPYDLDYKALALEAEKNAAKRSTNKIC